MNQCRAVVFRGASEEVQLEYLSRPTLSLGEVLVRVLGCTICGSDLHSYCCRRKVPVPTILGHEIVGEIVEFGAGATKRDLSGCELQVGDRIVWGIVAHCGNCFYCLRGLTQKCLNSTKYGHEVFESNRSLLGGLADYCLLKPQTSVVKLPSSLSLAVACPASCSTATVSAVVGKLPVDLHGQTVVVFGCGMLGLTACAMIHARGAASIIAVDVSTERLEISKRFGATHGCTPDEVISLSKSLSSGFGADAVFELSGKTASFETGLRALRFGGILVSAGAVLPTAPMELNIEFLTRNCLAIHGVHNYGPVDLLAAVRFLEEFGSQYPFDSLVANWYALDDIKDAFESAKDIRNIRVGVISRGPAV